MEKIYGYARVSSKEQNLDRQIIALREYVTDDRDIITDKVSGKDFERPGYRSLRDTLLRAGDTLIIKSLDRLGRNKEQVKQELQWFKAHGIRLKVIDLPTTMAELAEDQKWIIEMVNNILIEVLSSIAEQERETIRQRQAEGIAAAKMQGRHIGRPSAEYPERWEQVYRAWKSGGISATRAMNELKMKKTTFYRLVKRYEQPPA